MRKFVLVLFVGFLFSAAAIAQKDKPKLYNPEADAKADIKKAVAQAAEEGKHVLLQFGGNWCGWCILFSEKVESNDTLRTAMNDNYVSLHVNWSPESKNEDLLIKYGHPERFGFPVFVILDAKGNRIHTQNSAYLEEGAGHNTRKVLEFFNHWSPAALDPKNYKE